MDIKGRILITGGAGFIGSNTADFFVEHRIKIRVFDNLSSKTHLNGKWPSYLNSKVEKFRGDVRYKQHLLQALQGVDYVVHLAACQDLLPEFSKFFQVNVVGTANIYELIVKYKLPIKKVVVASSQFVYGLGKWKCAKDGVVFPKKRDEERLKKGLWDPICPICGGDITPLPNTEDYQDPPNHYAISKYCQELIALKLGALYNIPSVALRYSITHGKNQSVKNAYSGALRQFVLLALEGKPLSFYEDGQQLRDFVSVKDVARANLMVLESPKANYEIYNVGGNQAYKVVDLARMVLKVLGRKAEIIPMSSYRAGDIRHAVSDIRKIKKLGWTPQFSEEDSIKEFVQWVRKQKVDKGTTEKSLNKLDKIGVTRKVSKD